LFDFGKLTSVSDLYTNIIVGDVLAGTFSTWVSVRGASQNFREFEYTAQTVSATNLSR